MEYALYYWPTIQGRGEFIRLAFAEADIAYVDVAREPEEQGGGVDALLRLMDGAGADHPPFAPPFLKAGDLLLAQTANILRYLGEHHRLAPSDEAGRLWAHQLQLTLCDLVDEVHDTHHPIGGGLYYEQQKAEALRRAADFRAVRLPKYLGYFERILARNGNLAGGMVSYCDLSLFQIVEGLRYAFPQTMKVQEKRHPHVAALRDAIAQRRLIAAYLASNRRIPFNQQGIFRHYAELDEAVRDPG